MGERLYSFRQVKLKEPGKLGWARELGGDRQPIGIVFTVNRHIVGTDHNRILEKWE
jgi:hypothetical protein